MGLAASKAGAFSKISFASFAVIWNELSATVTLVLEWKKKLF